MLNIFHVLLDLTLTTTLQDQLDYDSPFPGGEKDKEKSMEFNEFILLAFAEYLLRPDTDVCIKKRVLDRQSPFSQSLCIYGEGRIGRECYLSEASNAPLWPLSQLLSSAAP